MDKAVKRRLAELEARTNSESGPVLNIRVMYVSPPSRVEDDDGTRKGPRKVN
jgi:hypothetical protein